MRRFAEAVGSLAAGAAVNLVIGLLQSESSMTQESWVVSAIIPTVFLAFYWFVIEPRYNRERAAKRRFRRSLERLLEREYKLNPDHNLSPNGRMFEGAADPFRKGRYRDLEIGDLFAPDPANGQRLLEGKAEEGERLLAHARKVGADRHGIREPFKSQVMTWEREVSDAVLFYDRSVLRKGHAAGFTKHSFVNKANFEEQFQRLEREVREVGLYASDQAKLAAKRGERPEDY